MFEQPSDEQIQAWRDAGYKPVLFPVGGIPFVYRELQSDEANSLSASANNESQLAEMVCDRLLLWPLDDTGKVISVTNRDLVPAGCAMTLFDQIQLTGGYGVMMGPSPLYDIDQYEPAEEEAVNKWKFDGLKPHTVGIGHITFIYRELLPDEVGKIRLEYLTNKETDEAMRLKVCKTALLWPDIDLEVDDIAPGTVSTLYKCIMITGGYEATTPPIRL